MGRALADNRQIYRLVLIAERVQGVDGTLNALSALIAIDDNDRKRVTRDIERQRPFVPVTVRDDLRWDEVARVEVESLDLPGVSVDEGFSRQYRFGDMLAPVVGYVAAVSEAEDGNDPLLDLPGFRIGKAGVEKSYDVPLRGAAGTTQLEVNAVGRTVRVLDRKESEQGVDLTVSIDLDLQRTAVTRLGVESGSAVVVDVRTGEILVMASTPAYDPDAFNRGLSTEEWKALADDPKAPLINKAISGLYAPGSTFKPVVALAGLERGVINPSTMVFCPGVLRLGNLSFHCWRRGGHGSVRLREALTQSCDCYFYEAAKRVGVDKIAQMGRRLGLGAPLGVDLPHERGGLLPTRDWKTARFGTPWSTGETVITGIGQGYVLCTPLQLAVMTARIANGGRAVVPRLARDADLAEAAGVRDNSARDRDRLSPPPGGAGGHVQRRQRRSGHGKGSGDPHPRFCHGRQDRHFAGPAYLSGREKSRRDQERALALGKARPRAVHRIRALRTATLCCSRRHRARRRRFEGGRSGRARHPRSLRSKLERSRVAARGAATQLSQEDRAG